MIPQRRACNGLSCRRVTDARAGAMHAPSVILGFLGFDFKVERKRAWWRGSDDWRLGRLILLPGLQSERH